VAGSVPGGGVVLFKATLRKVDVLFGKERAYGPTVMTSLVAKVGSIVPRESGERVLCAAYVSGSGSSIGSAVIAVSDRHLFFAPRSAFLSRGAWRTRRLDDVRIESSARRSISLAGARRFEVIDEDGYAFFFELEQRKEAAEFRKAFGRRLAAKR
jgi:hypothetical protein